MRLVLVALRGTLLLLLPVPPQHNNSVATIKVACICNIFGNGGTFDNYNVGDVG